MRGIGRLVTLIFCQDPGRESTHTFDVGKKKGLQGKENAAIHLLSLSTKKGRSRPGSL